MSTIAGPVRPLAEVDRRVGQAQQHGRVAAASHERDRRHRGRGGAVARRPGRPPAKRFRPGPARPSSRDSQPPTQAGDAAEEQRQAAHPFRPLERDPVHVLVEPRHPAHEERPPEAAAEVEPRDRPERPAGEQRPHARPAGARRPRSLAPASARADQVELGRRSPTASSPGRRGTRLRTPTHPHHPEQPRHPERQPPGRDLADQPSPGTPATARETGAIDARQDQPDQRRGERAAPAGRRATAARPSARCARRQPPRLHAGHVRVRPRLARRRTGTGTSAATRTRPRCRTGR